MSCRKLFKHFNDTGSQVTSQDFNKLDTNGHEPEVRIAVPFANLMQ